MKTIEVKDVPIIVGDESISSLEVKPINLVTFVKLAEETSALGFVDSKKWQVHNKRLRIKHQVSAKNASGNVVELDDMAITQLPIKYALQINELLSEDIGEEGEVVGTGDGVTSPLLFKLGSPIGAKTADKSKVSIVELEFMASTFGELEDVLAETYELSQVLALVRSVAKPLGANDTLQRLPSWAVDAITLGDGFAIARKVLPRFLGQPGT